MLIYISWKSQLKLFNSSAIKIVRHNQEKIHTGGETNLFFVENNNKQILSQTKWTTLL